MTVGSCSDVKIRNSGGGAERLCQMSTLTYKYFHLTISPDETTYKKWKRPHEEKLRDFPANIRYQHEFLSKGI
jgi:hypothetical protein